MPKQSVLIFMGVSPCFSAWMIAHSSPRCAVFQGPDSGPHAMPSNRCAFVTATPQPARFASGQ
eukprot:1783686-Pyramimonas_sp.AAC.1